ncbi:MAG: hypothetical protein ACI4IQ_04985 [Eubacterium sp.]
MWWLSTSKKQERNPHLKKPIKNKAMKRNAMCFDKLKRKLFISAASFVLSLCMGFLCPFSAFAFNTDYVTDPSKWNNCGNIILYDSDGFSGCLKYLEDNQTGCFYTYLYFYDTKISDENDSNIILSFVIENDAAKYKLCINKDGITEETDRIAQDRVEVYYNFDNVSCSKSGGEILVGFSLTNKDDMLVNNKIKCEYSCGLSSTHILFDNIYLDMSVNDTTSLQQTEKSITQTQTSNKTSSTTAVSKIKADTTAALTQNDSSNSSIKESSSSSTKFVPSSVTSKSSSSQSVNSSNTTQTEAFSADNKGSSSTYAAVAMPQQTSDAGDFQSEESSNPASVDSNIDHDNQPEGAVAMSNPAKLCLASAVVIFVLGTALISVGCAKKAKKPKVLDEINNTDDKEN